jgi:molybdopterin converting factor small subunit
MSVKISMPIFLQPFTGNKDSVEVEGETVGECLGVLMKTYPDVRKMLVDDKGKLHSYVGVYINGQDAFPGEMSKRVKSGDEIHVLYALAGG